MKVLDHHVLKVRFERAFERFDACGVRLPVGAELDRGVAGARVPRVRERRKGERERIGEPALEPG